MKTCATCTHSRQHELQKPKGPIAVKPGAPEAPKFEYSCHRNPPTPFPMIIPPAVQGAPAQIQVRSFWAPVDPNEVCGEYSPAVGAS